jgi:hypothetical protein
MAPACRFRYFDQSLRLVERAVTGRRCFSHGEKAKVRGRVEIDVIADPDRFQRRVARAAFGYLAQVRGTPIL